MLLSNQDVLRSDIELKAMGSLYTKNNPHPSKMTTPPKLNKHRP